MIEKILTIILKIITELLIKKGKKEIKKSDKRSHIGEANSAYGDKVQEIIKDPNLTDEEKNEKLKRLGRDYLSTVRV